MKLSPRRLLASLVLVAILAVMAWLCINYLSSRSRVNDFKSALGRKGEKFDLDAVLPPALVQEKNSLATFRRAMSRMYPLNGVLSTNAPEPMVMAAPGKAIVEWRQSQVRHSGTNSWEEVLAELEADEDGLRILEEIIQKPAFDFHLNYGMGFNMMLPHLSELKRSVQELKTAALCDLHRGDAGSALRRIRTALAMTKAMEEPIIISQLVRYAMANIAVSATWELLQARVSESDLLQLQTDWETLDLYPGAERAVEVERAMLENVADQMRDSSAQYRNVMSAFGTGGGGVGGGNWVDQLGRDVVLKVHESAWRYGASYHDQLKALKGHQIVISAIREARTAAGFHLALEKQTAELSKAGFEVKTNSDDNWLLFGNLNPGMLLSQTVLSEQKFPQRLFATETARQLVITAIALKRFYLRVGAFPSDLQELVPDFITTVPADPADRKPLRYHLNESNTFMLYSIGVDGVDDRGDVTPPSNTTTFPWLKTKDQVWPQSATEAQIEHFYSRKKPR